jgi:hypothetical protein
LHQRQNPKVALEVKFKDSVRGKIQRLQQWLNPKIAPEAESEDYPRSGIEKLYPNWDPKLPYTCSWNPMIEPRSWNLDSNSEVNPWIPTHTFIDLPAEKYK